MLIKGLKKLKTTILPDNRAQVRRGGGVSGGSAKSPSFAFFLKPSLSVDSYKCSAVQRAEIDELDSLDSTLSENSENSPDILTLPDLVKNKKTFTFKKWLVIKPETK